MADVLLSGEILVGQDPVVALKFLAAPILSEDAAIHGRICSSL